MPGLSEMRLNCRICLRQSHHSVPMSHRARNKVKVLECWSFILCDCPHRPAMVQTKCYCMQGHLSSGQKAKAQTPKNSSCAPAKARNSFCSSFFLIFFCFFPDGQLKTPDQCFLTHSRGLRGAQNFRVSVIHFLGYF